MLSETYHPKMCKVMYKRLFLITAILSVGYFSVSGQGLLDDFNRSNNSTVGNGWSERESAGAEINSSELYMGSGSPSAKEQVYRDVSGEYITTPGNNTTTITWMFNMHQSRSDPSGFGSGSYGVAFVLGCTQSDFATGNGYAVTLGETGSTDRLSLVSFTGGLSSNSNLSTVVAGGDFGDEFLAVKVTYNPATGNWALYYQSGNSSFTDPQSVVSWSQTGSATSDNSYTNSSLDYAGALFNHGTSTSDHSRFDNFYFPLPEVNFSTAKESIGEAGAGTFNITINASHTGSHQVDVELAGSGSAVNGTDISSYSTYTAGFSASKSDQTQVSVTSDVSCEGTETLVFRLNNVTGCRKGSVNTFTLYLKDDDDHRDIVFDDRFESPGFSSLWTNTGDWDVSDNSAVSDSASLRHNVSGSSGESYIYTSLGHLSLNNDKVRWRFQLRNLSWSPSSNNRFWVYLTANEGDLNGSTVDGYAVGVNMAGSDDKLKLWRVTDGSTDEVLISSSFTWGSSETVAIQITRGMGGEWFLRYDTDGGFDNLQDAGSVFDDTYTFSGFFGLCFDFTSTVGAGKLIFDDLEITQKNCYSSFSWNGGAGTEGWQDGKNWDNDLAPANSSASVRLDNSGNSSNYTVSLSTGDTLEVNSLTIDPGDGKSIFVNRQKNLVLKITGSGTALKIYEGGKYVDHSQDGMPDLTNNGDIYIDQNAIFKINTNSSSIPTSALESALSSGCSDMGLVEIRGDGQTLSASGKTYPTGLKLSSYSGSITYSVSGSNDFQVKGDFTIGNGVTFSSSMSGALVMKKDLINNGTMSFSNSQEVIFSGSSAQNISGNPLTFHSLKIGNGSVVTQNPGITVNNTLTLNSGLLKLQSNDLTLAQGAVISGGSSGSYIKTPGAGLLKMSLNSSSQTFPLGYNPYTPVTIQCNTCSGSEDFKTGVRKKVFEDPETKTNRLTSHVVNLTWLVMPLTSVTGVDVTVRWNSGEELSFNRGSAFMSYWDSATSTSWDETSVTVNGTDPYSSQLTGLSLNAGKYFFGVGDDNSPLPVELVYFTAVQKGNAILLEWETASEVAHKRTDLQKLSERENWKRMAIYPGKGNRFVTQQYHYMDSFPSPGMNYYRLQLTGRDGSKAHSNVVAVYFRQDVFVRNPSFRIKENPVTKDKMEMELRKVRSGKAMVRLLSSTGKVRLEKQTRFVPGQKRYRVPVDHLVPGLYYVQILYKDQAMGQRVIISH